MLTKPKATYVETLLLNFKDKPIEIYTGDAYKTHIYSDYEISRKQVLKGILRDGCGDCLVLECTSRMGVKTMVFVNSWAIHAVMEDVEGTSFMEIFVDSNLGSYK